MITRHPLIAIACFLALLAVLIVPLFALELGQEDIGATPTDTQERQAYDLIAAGFGAGLQRPPPDRGRPGHAGDRPTPRWSSRRTRPTSLQAQLEQEQKEGQQQQAALEAAGRRAEGPAGGAGVRAGEPGGPGGRPGPPGRRPAGAAAPGRGRAGADSRPRSPRSTGSAASLLQRAEASCAALPRRRSPSVRRASASSRACSRPSQAAEARLAAAPPEAAGAIRAQIAAQTNEAERLRGAIASARAQEQQLLSQAGDAAPPGPGGRRERPSAGVAAPAGPPARRSNAASLASNAASLERQQASLEAQGAALQAQGGGAAGRRRPTSRSRRPSSSSSRPRPRSSRSRPSR